MFSNMQKQWWLKGIIIVATIAGLLYWLHSTSCVLPHTGIQDTKAFHDGLRFIITLPGKEVFVTADVMGGCKVWDSQAEHPLTTFQISSGIGQLDASPDGRYLVASGDGVALVTTSQWQVRTVSVCPLFIRWIAKDARVAVVDAKDNLQVNALPDMLCVSCIQRPLPGTTASSLAAGVTSNVVAIGGDNGSFKVINLDTGLESMGTIGKSQIKQMIFVCYDSLLLIGDADGVITLWDVAKRKLKCQVYAHTGSVGGLSMGPTNAHFFSIGFDYTVKCWETNTLRRCWSVKVSNKTSAICVSYSADLRSLLIGLPTGQIRQMRIDP